MAASAFTWTRARLRLLGKLSDKELARVLGISWRSVRRERLARATPPSPHSKYLWTKAALKLLGTASDGQVAQRLNISATSVRMKRVMLGISASRAYRRAPLWTKEMLTVLKNEIPDIEVATRFNVSVSSVRRKRYELGLRRFSSKRIVWTKRMIRDVGRLSYEKFRSKYNISTPTILAKRRELGLVEAHVTWKQSLVDLLGKLPDEEIAKRLGCSRYVVRKKRNCLKIAPVPRRPKRWTANRKKYPHSYKHAWDDKRLSWLGKISDAAIAKRMNIDRATVARKRRALGIAPISFW